MKKVYEAANMMEAQLIKDYLEGAGVETVVKGAMLQGAVGEIPANTYPSIWAIEDDEVDKARELIDVYFSEQPENMVYQGPWTCPECGQELEPQFTQCWNCGTYRRE